MMTREEAVKRYCKAYSYVQGVYNKIYSDEGSDIPDDLLHDNMLYQLEGMQEEWQVLLDELEDDESEGLSELDFTYIDQAVVYAMAVDKALKVCRELDETQAPFA